VCGWGGLVLFNGHDATWPHSDRPRHQVVPRVPKTCYKGVVMCSRVTKIVLASTANQLSKHSSSPAFAKAKRPRQAEPTFKALCHGSADSSKCHTNNENEHMILVSVGLRVCVSNKEYQFLPRSACVSISFGFIECSRVFQFSRNLRA
jgi:hypothetical protein